uniref:RNA helicase n=1 Tax=Panagrellus redivivus TaxID=6233 RepID=A0A7E4ZZ28_PANRE
MVHSTHFQRHTRLSTVNGRVSKRPRGPREQRRSAKKSEVTRALIAEKHAILLEELKLAPTTIGAAAAKFAAFVEVEKLADQLDTPLVDRLIASEVRFADSYRVIATKKQEPGQKGKPVVTAIVSLTVGADANWQLVKEREGIILAKGPEEEREEEEQPPIKNYACLDAPMEDAPKKEKSSLGRRIYGCITQRNGCFIQVRLTCKANILDSFKELPLQLYVDINTTAQENQLEAIARVAEKQFIQKKLGFEVASLPKAASAPSRSRSPSIVCLDDEMDGKQSSFASSSSSSIICLDDLPEQPPKPSTFMADLNDEQKRAIEEIKREDTNNVFMLFGPPGTGKTHTLVKAVAELVRLGDRVLICTPSNKAADHIACGLLNEGLGKGTDDALYRHVSRTLDASLVPAQLRSHAGIESNGDELRFATDEIDLDDYAIVISTLGSTPSLRKLYTESDEKFDYIIVDEAGQAAEMEVWMPMAFFACRRTRLIVAGDPMQLGPVASVHLLDDPAYGYKTSILSRLYQNEAFRSDSQNMVQLTKNYRSHEAIVNVVSQVFYNDTLEFTRPAGHDSLDDWHRLPQSQFPVFFENVYGRVQTDRNGSSSNEAEANAVVFYIESLLRSRRVKAHEIGVVSPYTAQTQLIRHLLGPSSEVTVDTVEKFQGSERRVIIMTAVRNGTALGFMEDRQRLNTALSRAQQLLIVIGHGRSLEALPDWFKFIDYCKANNAYVDASDIADSRMY